MQHDQIVKARRSLLAQGGGQSRDVRQEVTVGTIAAWCAANHLAPDELNSTCRLRTGLASVGVYFSQPCQVWLRIHMQALNEILAGSSLSKFLLERGGDRVRSIEQLTIDVHKLLLVRVGEKTLLDYEAAILLTGESRQAQEAEQEKAASS